MNQKEVNEAFWAAMVEQAGRGNVEAARDVLTTFAETVEQVRLFNSPWQHWSGPIPWAAADYLATGFRAILNGADHAKALNLVAPKRGRHKMKVVTHDQEALAASFFFLRRKKFKPEQINAELREELGADRATIYRARREYRGFENRRRFKDEHLKVSLAPYAAHVRRILERLERRTK
jgi:hypothetical protein